jgi:hypothetical protein
MQRGWSSFADTRQIIFSKTIGEDHRFNYSARQCVGGDGHPVGGNWQLNDSWVFEWLYWVL